MTNHDTSMEYLREIIADAIDIDEEELTPDAHFIDDIGVDSLVALEVLVRLEKEYGIKIPENELAKITSLNAVHQLVSEKTAN